MFGLGATELIVILVVALLIFGPGKLPEIGGALGKGIRDFRKSFEGKDGKDSNPDPEITERQENDLREP